MGTPERFRPTGGRLTGWLGAFIGLVVAGMALVDRSGPWLAFVFGGLLFAAIAWATSLRPALWVDDDSLTMRNVASTRVIPLAAISELAIRQVFAVRAGDRRYVSPVIGHSLRKTIRTDPKPLPNDGSLPGAQGPHEAVQKTVESYPVFVESRIRALMEAARARAGLRMGSEEQARLAEGVRREVAWPVVGLIGGLLLALVVTLLL